MTTIEAKRIAKSIIMLDDEAWKHCPPALINRYWSGEDAPPERHAEARLMWTDEVLCVRFRCRQNELLIAGDSPQTHAKTLGLWDYDVCEMFVAPDANHLQRYFEFEVAPTGEWLDLGVEITTRERVVNWNYSSEMQAEARVKDDEILILMRVPWKAFGSKPNSGDEWRVNFFRCVGANTERQMRGYLAWQPTHTPAPNFHVPQVFGTLRFVV